jgi:hypothetical protein
MIQWVEDWFEGHDYMIEDGVSFTKKDVEELVQERGFDETQKGEIIDIMFDRNGEKMLQDREKKQKIVIGTRLSQDDYIKLYAEASALVLQGKLEAIGHFSALEKLIYKQGKFDQTGVHSSPEIIRDGENSSECKRIVRPYIYISDDKNYACFEQDVYGDIYPYEIINGKIYRIYRTLGEYYDWHPDEDPSEQRRKEYEQSMAESYPEPDSDDEVMEK